MPGVRKVYTAANIGLADFQGFPMMPEAFNRPVIAGDTVRFVGDIVAVVIAETKAQAVDAGEAIIVDYDPLPVAATIEAAAAPDAPLLFPAHGSNVCFATALGEDVDALEGADKVGRVKMVSQRPAGVTPADSPIVKAALAADAALGITTRLSAGSTDSNIPISLGVPAITISGGGAGRNAHSLDESFDTTDSHVGTQRALLIVLGIVGAR